MNYKSVFKIFILLILVINCPQISFAQDNNPIHELFTYDFGGLEDEEIEYQFNLLKNLGFDGITIYEPMDGNPSNTIEVLQNWYNMIDTSNTEFKISAFYYRHNYDGGWENESLWKPVMDKLAEKTIPFLVIVKEDEKGVINYDSVLAEFTAMADYGNSIGLPVVIYPHSNTYIESAEEALPYVQDINDSNFTLSLHLCHELRAGNKDRMIELINSTGPYISVVTINGADAQDIGEILPLDEGDYDKDYLLPALKAIGFSGPIGIHTHKITQDPLDHLPRSLTWLEQRIDDAYVGTISYNDLNAEATKIYPNPSNGNFILDANSDRIESVLIYDIYGKVMEHYANYASTKFNLNLTPGIYFLQFRQENQTQTLRLIIQ